MSKTALITGGAKRIGKALSIKLAELGYNIILHYNNSQDDAEDTSQQIRSVGVGCDIFSADLSDPQAALRITEKILEKNKGVELLVNNASVFYETGFLNVSEEDFQREFNINFVSPFFLIQQFALICRKGLVINMIDARITKVHTSHFVYNLTKKSLFHLTHMTAKTLGPDIRVNGICPGPILPPPGEDQDFLRTIAAKTPLKRMGDTSYISQAVEYLVKNNYVTGETLFVDGGEHL